MKDQNSPTEKVSNYKSTRKRVLEIALLFSIILVSSLFYSFKKFDNKSKLVFPRHIGLTDVVLIPPTIQPEKIVRPTLPAIPVPSEDDDFCEEVDYDLNKLDITELIKDSGPPEDEQEEPIPFEWVEVKPKIRVKVQPIYPDIAKKTGTTGLVVIRVLIDKKGNVEKAEILKSSPMLDKAALDAAKKCKFEPAMQRDKYVKVWMAIPFNFMLR